MLNRLNYLKSKSRIFIIVLTAGLFLLGCGNDSDQKAAEPPVAVRISKPKIQTLQERMSYIGTIHPQKEVQIIAQVQGTVEELPYREGQRISRGDVLVEISAPEILARVDRLTAERNYWCNRFAEDQRLVEKGALAPVQAEASQRACKSARAALSEGQSQLEKTAEKAPFSGEVLNWFVEPGQSMMPGQPVLLIGSDLLEIQVDVIEEDLQRGLKAEMPVEIQLNPGQRISAAISEISPISSGSARTFRVTVPLPAGVNSGIRKGVSVRIEFILKSGKDVLTVPLNAVADFDRNPHLFLVSGNTARKQPVKIGVQERGWVEVNFPWNGEDWVAVTNLGGLSDGAPVFAVRQEEVK